MRLLVVLFLLLVGQVLCSKRAITPNGINLNGIALNSLTFNALTANAITHNALTSNGISLNSLTNNALSGNGLNGNGILVNAILSNALVANALNAYVAINPNATIGVPTGIGSNGFGITDPQSNLYFGIAVDNGTLLFSKEQDSAEVSQFFQYLVKCALAPTDSWTLTLNGTDYTFPGVLGLTPEIKERPLYDNEGRLLSACLLAHVNHFGIHVSISVRSGDKIAVTQDELDQYRVYEGAFFGDLANATMYSCQGEPQQQALRESSSRSLRVCTDGSTCGFTSVGRCQDVCNFYLGELGYKNCTPDGTTYFVDVMNVYLKSDLEVASAVISAPVWIAITTLLYWISF